MRKLCVFVIITFIASAIGGIASAQDTTGTLSGRIVDAQGLALPGVTITATGSQGNKTAISGGDGRVTVPFLTRGRNRGAETEG